MWHARPLADQDIPAVVAMVNECELADSGEVLLDADDIAADLAAADRERDACVVVQQGRIVGWGLVWERRKRWADVHPAARGQGIGSWLLKWSAWRAGQLGAVRVGQTIDDRREDVARFFAGHGYTPRYTSWILAVPAARGAHRATPARTDEVDLVLDLFERSFAQHEDRTAVQLEQWRARTVLRSGFVPEDLMVLRVQDRPVAASFSICADEVWVDKVAVEPDFRRQGLARELVTAARDRAAGLGFAQVRLSTDSMTGALEVYERLGFGVQRSYTHWAVDLQPG